MVPRLRWCLAGLVLLGCSKRNPDYCDEDEPCPDPSMPFCDLDGLVDGSPNSCIAVACTPGEFAACDEDRAIQCNTAGNNYDTVLCERGCDPASDGCRLCDPNETACTNGITATCDASGAVVSMEACALGCFESEPRCRKVDPSNALAQYLDMAAAGPELVLTDGTINTVTGEVRNGDGSLVLVPSVGLPAPPGGVPIRVFAVRSATIDGLRLVGNGFTETYDAFALVAQGPITISGLVDLAGYTSSAPPGVVVTGPCTGKGGVGASQFGHVYAPGGGGGANAEPGMQGGTIQNLGGGAGGVGGQGSSDLDGEPLHGGCLGSTDERSAGGAVQLVSAQTIILDAGAVIDANGGSGFPPTTNNQASGGGSAGGTVLLEAPSIELRSTTKLVANGGAGASATTVAGPTSTSVEPTPGATCSTGTGTSCTAGGQGGAANGAPLAGVGLNLNTGTDQFTGGGGGAVGVIRLNTRDGAYLSASDAILSPAPRTGSIRTR